MKIRWGGARLDRCYGNSREASAWIFWPSLCWDAMPLLFMDWRFNPLQHFDLLFSCLMEYYGSKYFTWFCLFHNLSIIISFGHQEGSQDVFRRSGGLNGNSWSLEQGGSLQGPKEAILLWPLGILARHFSCAEGHQGYSLSGCSAGAKRLVIYRREYYKQALYVTLSLYKNFYHISLLILGFLFLPHRQKRANKNVKNKQLKMLKRGTEIGFPEGNSVLARPSLSLP